MHQSVTFEMRPFKGDVAHPKGMLEHVRIDTGTEVVHRVATDEDRRVYFQAYAAFKAGPVATPSAPVLVASTPVAENTGKVDVDPELLAKSALTDEDETPVDSPKGFFGKKKKK